MNDNAPRKANKSNYGGMTLEEAANELGISKERVRQIEQKALQKLSRKLRALGITADDLIHEDLT